MRTGDMIDLMHTLDERFGRQVDVSRVATRDGLVTVTPDQMSARFADMITQQIGGGGRIAIDEAGQRKILAMIEPLLAQAIAEGCIVGEIEAVARELTPEDIATKTLRFTFRPRGAS